MSPSAARIRRATSCSFTLHFVVDGRRAGARRRARHSAVARQVLLGVALAAAGHRSRHELRGRSCSVRFISTGCAAWPSSSWSARTSPMRGPAWKIAAAPLYMYVVFIAGLAAPLFLFLAGLTIAMAASARAVKVGHAEAAALARRRGLQMFALAFLFRLQSQLLGWGAFTNFLKVDILNVMGIAMIAAAILWGLSANRLVRIVLFAIATVVVAMATPLVREARDPCGLAGCRSRHTSGRCPAAPTSRCFPGPAFSSPARIAGELVFAAQSESQERRLQAACLICRSCRHRARLRGLVSAVDLSGREFLDQLADVLLHPPRHLHGDGAARVRRRSVSRVPAPALCDCARHRTCPAGSSRRLAARRCSSTGFTSRWRTAASPGR